MAICAHRRCRRSSMNSSWAKPGLLEQLKRCSYSQVRTNFAPTFYNSPRLFTPKLIQTETETQRTFHGDVNLLRKTRSIVWRGCWLAWCASSNTSSLPNIASCIPNALIHITNAIVNATKQAVRLGCAIFSLPLEADA